jgi:hypothetical protein
VATELNGSTLVLANYQYQTDAGALANRAFPVGSSKRVVRSNGSLADQAQKLCPISVTLAASANSVIDLTALTDVFGAAVNLARVDEILLSLTSTTDALTVTFQADTTNGWTALLNSTGQLSLRSRTTNNDGMFLISSPGTTGYAVSGSSKRIKLTNTSGSTAVTINGHIIGRTV